MTAPVFRFAPSPNGYLHLGHAYSAILNYQAALSENGRFLLRIEDIDTGRATSGYENAILEDLAWLGLTWRGPVRRQSEHFQDYEQCLNTLIAEDLVYPAFMTRGQLREHIIASEKSGTLWPRDPDGSPLYPDIDRKMTQSQAQRRIQSGEPYAWRLDTRAALSRVRGDISWLELGCGPRGESGTVPADPAQWGDVIIARKDIPTSYHLSVVIDDALQDVTQIVRGADLFHATAIQRLLQELLGLPVPVYRHHRLIMDHHGQKMSKSRGSTTIRSLRESGATPADIRRMIGL